MGAGAALLPGWAGCFGGSTNREMIAGIVGDASKRFTALRAALVTVSVLSGDVPLGPLTAGADVTAESRVCRGRNVAGIGDEGVKFGESAGLLSMAMVGGGTSVAAGGETLAGWRAAAAGAIAGSTIGVSFGRAGEIVTGVGVAWSAKFGRAALGEAAGSVAIGCAGEMVGASAASGADCDGSASVATGASHVAGGHSQQQHRRFRSLQAAAGSTSKRHTEIQTSAR
jgi:hypothetical protein